MFNLPKVLIVGAYTFNENNATSLTMRNLFSNWDIDKISFIYFTNSFTEETPENVFKVNTGYKISSNFVNRIKSERSFMPGMKRIGTGNSVKSLLFNKLHSVSSAYRSLMPIKYSDNMDKFIQEFKPDVIYSPLGSIQIMGMVLRISKKYKISVVPHFMDDWKSILYANDFLLKIPCIVKDILLKKIIEKSKFGFSISPYMAREYSEEFHIPFYPLMNCVNDDNNAYKLNIHDNSNIVFSYCGGLHLNRWETLIQLCSILQNLKQTNFKLLIYTKEDDWKQFYDKFSDFTFVEYKGFVSSEELRECQINHDVFVHVESFDKETLKYTRLSISTKIPEYLSFGKPIIALGPSGIASIEYLRENNCAIILDENFGINDELLDKLNDNLYLSEISRNAFSTFKKNHTTAIQSLLLMNKLSALVTNQF